MPTSVDEIVRLRGEQDGLEGALSVVVTPGGSPGGAARNTLGAS